MLNCPMQFTIWRKERRIHKCCALVLTSALLIGGFCCQNHIRTIVCSTTTLCKALGEVIVFRNESLASALCACFRFCPLRLLSGRMSLCGLKNDEYSHTCRVLVVSSAPCFVISLVTINCFSYGQSNCQLWFQRTTMRPVTLTIVDSRFKDEDFWSVK